MASSKLSPEAQARWAAGVMLFFMLFGGLIAFAGYRDVARAGASHNWPTAKGTVLESRVTFTGRLSNEEVYRQLLRHHVLLPLRPTCGSAP